jgi:SNF2 family DNA or RNA helicase
MITRKLSGRVRGLRLVKNRLKLTLRVSTIDLIWTKSLPRLRKPTRIKIISFSTKFTFLFKLLRNFREEGHRVLIFSMSKKNLDLIEDIIQSGYLGKDQDGDHVKYMRIDGNTEISEREAMCNDFNKDTKQFLGLLTTKVGGMGLNLAGADRAIIMDPDWNPANDN